MNARRALALFAAYIGAQVATGILIGLAVAVAFGTKGSGAQQALRSAAILGTPLALTVAGACVFWLTRRVLRGDPDGLRSIGWVRTTPGRQAMAAIVGLGLGAFFVFVVVSLFPLPPDVRGGPVTQAASEGGWKLYLWIVLAIFIGPPVELFVFRGVLWTGLARSWGPIAAAIVVTALFLAMHLLESGRYPPALFAITVTGLACLGARVLTGSLAPGIALHMAYNAVISAGMLREYG